MTAPRPRIAIEGWAPEYGAPFESEGDPVTTSQVDVDAEVAGGEWCPLDPPADIPAPQEVVFLDGVRRIDARVWITESDGTTRPGICASYAAGVVRCGRTAEITDIRVERGCFARAGAPDIDTAAGAYPARPVAEDDLTSLINGLQERMGQLEVEVAGRFVNSPLHSDKWTLQEASGDAPSGLRTGTQPADTLLVIDGPLRGSQRIPGAIGYIKSHRAHYLPEPARQVVADLEPGQRTPIFLIQAKWSRFAWYLRLPGGEGHPWAGVVRCEAWADTKVEGARRLADATAAILPRFAAEPHKEGRAPQNLYPIAGLERELKHRLGDAGFVQRALRLGVAG